jgi:hypothetical protein
MKWFLCSWLLIASTSVLAAEPAEPEAQISARPIVLAAAHVLTSHGLLMQLQGYMRDRNIDAGALGAEEMVRLMVDWFRMAPISAADGTPATDSLLFRYGGWSEGCATAFKLSLLRQVIPKNMSEDAADFLAGITLMFEPSGQSEFLPFSTASPDWKSIDAFVQAVESSPAFRALEGAKPMSVMIESGAIR